MTRTLTTTTAILLTVTAAGALLASGALAQPARATTASPPVTSAQIATRPQITLDAANSAIAAAVAEARRLNAGGSIAVTDDGGHLVALVRLDNTFPASAEVACLKARTASIFRKNTQDFENAIKSGRTPLLGVDAMTPLEGGVPITIDGAVIGAVGVSGAHSSTEDVQIATAGAAAVSR